MEIFIACLLVVLIIMMIVAGWMMVNLHAQFEGAIGKLTRTVEHQIGRVVDGQRLSIILDLKGGNLLIKPEQFEPNREKLLTRLLNSIAEENSPSPDTWAWCLLNRSGLDLFIDSKDKMTLQKAFARLRANGDMNGARSLAHDIMKQL